MAARLIRFRVGICRWTATGQRPRGEAGSGGGGKPCGPQDQAPVAHQVASDTKNIATMDRHWPAGLEQVRLGVGMTRWRRGRIRWAIAGGLVIALVVAAVVAWPYVQRYPGPAPPPQFYDKVQLEPALAQDY